MNPARLDYLKALGVDVWLDRSRPSEAAPVAAVAPHVAATPMPSPETAPPAAPVGDLNWDALQERVAQCRECVLCESRTQTVFGVGDRSARWMIVGEAPGAEEDRRGEPFVGRAGQLLDAMLVAAGFERKQVYIANVLKCRPPNNRDPGADEAAACIGYLHRQIELVAPDLIIAVGKVAAQRLLDTTQPLGKIRGRVHQLASTNTPVVVTYHPAYLLRSPSQKRKAWEDLLFAHRVARGEVQ